MEHSFSTVQWLDRPREEVFAFFAEARNLERITPPELKFSILNPDDVVIQAGALIDYRLHLAGIPFHWKTEITKWNPPFDFEDVQLKGPYGMWIHRHSFLEVNGGTRIEDSVRYRLPFSPLGDLAWPLVRLQLRRIFSFRTRAVEAYFKDHDVATPA